MPETIGLFALSELGIINFVIIGSVTAATVAGSAILIGGSIGLQLLLNRPQSTAAPGGPALPPPEAGHQPLKQAISPRIVGLGRVRLAGAYVLFEANNGTSYDVIAFHHGRIGGIVGYYLQDDIVTVDGSGIVDVQGDGRYGASSITIQTRLGLATETAYSDVVSALSAIWTTSHRGDGLASLYLKCAPVANVQDFPTIYPRQLPVPSVVADCTPIFDARDVTQSNGNDSTWQVSSNPMLQVMFFLTDSDRGMGLDYAALITPALTRLKAEADLCDMQVARNDGATEPRYASNGSYPLDSDPADVISSILDTCDGWLSQNGDGSLAFWCGVYRAPTVTLESKHIRGCSLQYGLAEEEAVNELTIDYTEPLLDYKTAPGQPWRNEQDISERGRTLSQRFALPWVYSHPQARRLAKRRDNQNNATLRGTISTTLYGIRCLGERWIQITAPDLPDLENVVIEVRGMTIDLLNATCQIKFISVNPNVIDAWDPATEEGSSPTVPSKLVFPPPPVPQNIVGTGEPGTTFVVSFDDPGRSDLTYQAAFRINGSGGAFTNAPIMNSFVGGSFTRPTIGSIAVPFSGTTYEIKVRSFAPAGAASAFSSTTTVAVP
jgi:hypothetical protein